MPPAEFVEEWSILKIMAWANMLNSVLFFSWCPHVELLILAFYILRYWWNCYWFLMPKVPWVLSASSFLIYWCCSKEYMKVIWKRNAASVMEGTFLVKQRSTSFDDYVMIVHKMGRNFPAIPIVCDQKTKTYSWWECLLIVTINFSQSIFFCMYTVVLCAGGIVIWLQLLDASHFCIFLEGN